MLLKLFNSYQVVGLGEGPHGNLEGHAFRLRLLRDPRFPNVVNDILVESATARYQPRANRRSADRVGKRDPQAQRPTALVIYGDGHFQGRGFKDNSLTNLIERSGIKMVTISVQYGGLIKIQPSVAAWQTPSLAAKR